LPLGRERDELLKKLRAARNSNASEGLGRVAGATGAEMTTGQTPTTGDKQALNDLADEALAVARSIPSGPAKIEALKKGRATS
jgi:hypothetical protein